MGVPHINVLKIKFDHVKGITSHSEYLSTLSYSHYVDV